MMTRQEAAQRLAQNALAHQRMAPKVGDAFRGEYDATAQALALAALELARPPSLTRRVTERLQRLRARLRLRIKNALRPRRIPYAVMLPPRGRVAAPRREH